MDEEPSLPKRMTPNDSPDLIDRVLENVQVLKEAASENVARHLPNGAAHILIDVVSSSPRAPSLNVQKSKSLLAMTNPDERQPIGLMALESAITTAVKSGVPNSQGFGGVVVEKLSPKSRFDANWAIRGIKFGRTDRERVNKALTNIAARMQADFRLLDD